MLYTNESEVSVVFKYVNYCQIILLHILEGGGGWALLSTFALTRGPISPLCDTGDKQTAFNSSRDVHSIVVMKSHDKFFFTSILH